ncbi:LCP family protein [Clostridium chauvoei]|uniref:LCP family protein n=2 Tax=Clostridium chauvoei TaxID=46867 RepID=A0ABD4RFW2_9CLOT|nr:LCP family protein [Clostridium chauvoei]ATD54369.1 transcriptional regulator [Clostridium chauvoei]ATD57947.1 transcriptional regulator [Clostridium chauvoei]MBX7279741.1 LCP family protein [Clostridium chauvoei]MBX7282110.1 LCP family protein [Clostridium chauvoei]MBX7284632.1 LCP family protein [Clostridium chauvoei]
MKKKLSLWKKILITILILILLCILGIASYAFHLSNKVTKVEMDREAVTDTGKELPKKAEDVTTVALLGTDYSGNEHAASDCTMILAIDKKNKKLNLCSLMRDIYLDLPDGGKSNLNYTMSSGGPELLLKTINYNFNLKVDKFVEVNLRQLPTVIDKLGGVEIDITEDELNYINGYIQNIDDKNGTKTSPVTSTGKQLLNGTQASAYCRIRYTEGRDFKRTERQRDVLTALFNKVKDINPTEIPGIVSDLLPLVSTNLSNAEILSIASDVVGMNVNNINQGRFPLDDDLTTEWTDMYHMIIDVDKTTKNIHNFLFSE